MRVLLTGANGQVGWEIAQHAPELGIHIVAPTRSQLDLGRTSDIQNAFKAERFDLVINAAAYTKVDQAESDADAAYRINSLALRTLAECCSAQDIRLFHLSTDYVFDGNSTIPYSEDDPTSPIGVYGDSKLGGELAIKELCRDYLILRTSWVFGNHGTNFPKTILNLAKERNELKVVADQIGCPTYAGDLATTLLCLANRKDAVGTYHYRNEGPTTWHMYATHIVNAANELGLLNRQTKISPVSTALYPTPAKRPLYSVLDCSKFCQAFPDIGLNKWQDGVLKLLQSTELKQ